jgi:starch-binding outer membrane protein, SusD/RagB family
MNIKHIIKPLAVMTIAVSISGCKKYLDQQPITGSTTPIVFSDINGAYQALIGAYSRLGGQEGYGQRLSLYYTVDTDEAQGPTGSDDERRNIARYQPTASNTGLPNPFNQLFQGIEFANNVIDNVPKMTLYTSGTEQEKKKLQRMYGEALAIRAQLYFEAIRNWGDLPAHFTAATNQAKATPFPGRVDRDTLYNRIIEDLRIASTIVPWKNELATIGDQVDERITKGAVKGIRARIALFRGGYSLRQQSKTMERRTDYLTFYNIARQEALDIISSGQHALNPDYKSLWKDQVGNRTVADPNGELMFQVSSIGGVSAQDSRLGFYDGPRVGGLGNSAINVLPTYFYLFDSLDKRRDVSIAPYWVAADNKTKTTTHSSATNTSTSIAANLNPGKYRRDWNTSVTASYTGQFLGLKWQILRYSDVLLMFAEAENEINGPTDLAYNAINMVRRRGFGKPLTIADPTVDLPTGLGKADFFKAIVRERSLELSGEGVRKYDLLRWNLLQAALTETKANLTKLGNATSSNSVRVTDLTYSYQAAGPQYTTVLPLFVFIKTGTQADDFSIFANSLYMPAPSSVASTLRVPWLHSQINTGNRDRFATGFTPGRSELFPIPQNALNANPNLLPQNPGY